MATLDIGRRMKEHYEDRTRFYLPRRTNTIIRLDGVAFHTYTKNLEKPYDENLRYAMAMATKEVVKRSAGSVFGYFFSDEISILFQDSKTPETEAWFDGCIQKMASVSASMASLAFYNTIKSYDFAFFDARVFTIPDPVEVQNYFLWRQLECKRGFINMLAQMHFSPKELHGKNNNQRLEMLASKNVLLENYGRELLYGNVLHKSTISDFTEDEHLSMDQYIPCDWLKDRWDLDGLCVEDDK